MLVHREMEFCGFEVIESSDLKLSFFRHGEDYRPDVQSAVTGSGPQTTPATIGYDESPAGYSLASCSPAELAFVSPATAILLNLKLTVQCFFGRIASCV